MILDFEQKEKSKIKYLIRNELLCMRLIPVFGFFLLASFFFLVNISMIKLPFYLLLVIVFIFIVFLLFVQYPIILILYDVIVYLYISYLLAMISLAFNNYFKLFPVSLLLMFIKFGLFFGFLYSLIYYFVFNSKESALKIENNLIPIENMMSRRDNKMDKGFAVFPFVFGSAMIFRYLIEGSIVKQIVVISFLFFSVYTIITLGLYFRRIYQYLKYQKDSGCKIYTVIYPYLQKQKEINKLRRTQGLKSIEIRSFFYK